MSDWRERVFTMPETVEFQEPGPGRVGSFALLIRKGIGSAAGLQMTYPSSHVSFVSAQRAADSIDGTYYEVAHLGTLDGLIEKLTLLRDARDELRRGGAPVQFGS